MHRVDDSVGWSVVGWLVTRVYSVTTPEESSHHLVQRLALAMLHCVRWGWHPSHPQLGADGDENSYTGYHIQISYAAQLRGVAC